MKSHRLFASMVFAGIFILFAQSLFALDSKEETAAKNYAFQGLPLGSKLSEFSAKFPYARDCSEPEDKAIDHRIYSLETIQNTTIVFLYFFEDKLYQVRHIYDVETTNKLGGWRNIVSKIVEKYGKADADSEGTECKDKEKIANYYWKFGSVDRFIELTVKQKFVLVDFTDINIYFKVLEKKKDSVDLF